MKIWLSCSILDTTNCYLISLSLSCDLMCTFEAEAMDARRDALRGTPSRFAKIPQHRPSSCKIVTPYQSMRPSRAMRARCICLSSSSASSKLCNARSATGSFCLPLWWYSLYAVSRRETRASMIAAPCTSLSSRCFSASINARRLCAQCSQPFLDMQVAHYVAGVSQMQERRERERGDSAGGLGSRSGD